MYFDAKFADWVMENGYCPEVNSLKAAQRVLDCVMTDIYVAAIAGATKIETYCPDKYSTEIEDKLKDLGYGVEYIGDAEMLEVQW